VAGSDGQGMGAGRRDRVANARAWMARRLGLVALRGGTRRQEALDVRAGAIAVGLGIVLMIGGGLGIGAALQLAAVIAVGTVASIGRAS